jgi:hypothetical protein
MSEGGTMDDITTVPRSDEQLTKTLGKLYSALGEHSTVLFDRGLVEPDKLRLTIEARKEKAKELIDAGLSQRQAAQALGVDETTVRLRQTAAQDAAESRTSPEPTLFAPDPEQDAKADEKRARAERKQLGLAV